MLEEEVDECEEERQEKPSFFYEGYIIIIYICENSMK